MDGLFMRTITANTIIIVGTCQYTALGIATLLDNLLYRKIVFYQHFSEIKENSHELLMIAALDENDITYDDIVYLKNRMLKNGGQNLIILSDSILTNVLYSVFNIACLYLPRNITLKALHPVIVNTLLHNNDDENYHLKPQLTGMESQILIMLSEGFTVSEISRIKNKNCRTISSHKCNLMKKMGMPNTPKSFSVLSMYLKSIRMPGNKRLPLSSLADGKQHGSHY